MLSHQWTFLLTCLVVILMLGFVASSAMAQFEIKLSIGEGEDISFADGNQVFYFGGTEGTFINIMSTKVVNYHATATAATATADPPVVSGTALGADDFTVIAYNKFGGIATSDAPTLDVVTPVSPADGMHFTAELSSVSGGTPETTRVLIVLKKDSVELADPRAELNDDGTRKDAGKNKEATIELHYFHGIDRAGGDDPRVDFITRVDFIKRVGDVLRPVTEATFDVLVQLSEEPKKDTFTADRFSVDNATITEVTLLKAFDEEGGIRSTGYNDKLYQYILTVTPKYENKNDIVIKINEWETQNKVTPERYTPPATDAEREEGVHKLTVKVGKEDLKAKVAGLKVGLPKEKHIPAGGYLVVADDKEGSSIHWSESDIKDAPKAHQRTPAELKYNTIAKGLPNLETFLANGGVIGVMGPHAVMITEIMWGSDASLDDPGKSQWIELYNAGAGYQTQDGDNTTYLIFYGPGEAPAAGLHDVVGTVDDTAGYWSLANKGQSGRTAEKIAGAAVQQVATTPLISMQRVMDATGALKGTLASSWVASVPPSLNFEANRLGVHVGTPGAMPVTFPEPPAKEIKEEVPEIPVAGAADIMITEIMVDTGAGRLPQWIELTNVSGAEKSLAGWSLRITNSDAEADVIGATVSINLSGTLGVGGGMDAGGTMGKALLLVGGTARSSSNLSGSDRVVDISSQVGERGRYAFISTMAFEAALIPPQKTGVLTPGDTAGNLNAAVAWDLPMSDSGRSSLIRREMLADGMATMGTAANGWVLASSTSLVSGPATWYGSDEDAGTPGYDAGGPLPVELSHFRPARDKATGAVVITWATQSELNNAGFFIKRSQQRDGEFQVINATMVAGAGTTSEKQFYTYTDTTAQPNVVYYYQIEDVSLDGNRQTLTRGIRLKGHVGAAGKLTTTWGDLKASHE